MSIYNPNVSFMMSQNLEARRKALGSISSVNITQQLFQVAVNGFIEHYINMIVSYIYDNGLYKKKKGINPYKYLCDNLNDLKTKIIKKSAAVTEVSLKPNIMVVFPYYWDRFIKDVSLSTYIQVLYHNRYGSKAEEVLESIKEAFKTGGVESELYSYVILLESLTNLVQGVIDETHTMMAAKALVNGINLKRQQSGLYSTIKFTCSKFIAQTTGKKTYDVSALDKAKEACTNMQLALLEDEAMFILGRSVDKLAEEFVDMCVAYMVIDTRNGVDIPEEVKDYVKTKIDVPLKKLTQTLKRLSTAFPIEDASDLKDELANHKYKVIETLKANCKEI